jgi:RNase P subunit RPR2
MQVLKPIARSHICSLLHYLQQLHTQNQQQRQQQHRKLLLLQQMQMQMQMQMQRTASVSYCKGCRRYMTA